MDHKDHINLLRPADLNPGGVWADFGAGNGGDRRLGVDRPVRVELQIPVRLVVGLVPDREVPDPRQAALGPGAIGVELAAVAVTERVREPAEGARIGLAALVLAMSDEGNRAALAAAEWFALEGGRKQRKGDIAWYDEHSFDLQRMYDIVCILYGNDPKAHLSLVSAVGLPEDRRARCLRETPRKVRAWQELLRPHRR